MNRRDFVSSGLAFTGICIGTFDESYGNIPGVVQDPVFLTEEQAGDPTLTRESLSINQSNDRNIKEFLSRVSRGPKVPRPRLALETLKVAKTHIGVSRNPPAIRVKQYLSLFGLPFQYSNGKFVPYCAAGVGFAACQAYRNLTKQNSNIDASDAEIIFRDSLTDVKRDYTRSHPACIEMVNSARSARIWRPPKTKVGKRVQPKAGWLVFYNWDGGSTPQHVGIVDRATASSLFTVEFNTSDSNFSNGGAVLARERDYSFVIGYIDTYSQPDVS